MSVFRSWDRSERQELMKLSNNTWEVFQPAQKKNPDAVKYDIRVLKVAGTGFEQSGKPTIHGENSNQGDAESDALAAVNAQINPDLEFITRAWPDLSESVQKRLIGIISRSQKTDC